MAKIEDIIAKVTKKVGSKKAKVKPMKDPVPTDTKQKKLPTDLQKGLETHFKVDLKDVRLHTSKSAEAYAKKLGVKAFTHGCHIYLGKASDVGNKELIAHELTHVIQQNNGKKPPRDGKNKILTSK